MLDGNLLPLARTAAPFSSWMQFTWYWSTDNQPFWTKFMDFRSSAVRGIMEAVAAAESIRS